MQKTISILGSTGSIGVNALNVVRHLSDELDVVYLSAHTNAERMVEQCRDICKKCADVCAKHDHKHCQECADACRKCEEACNEYLK